MSRFVNECPGVSAYSKFECLPKRVISPTYIHRSLQISMFELILVISIDFVEFLNFDGDICEQTQRTSTTESTYLILAGPK